MKEDDDFIDYWICHNIECKAMNKANTQLCWYCGTGRGD